METPKPCATPAKGERCIAAMPKERSARYVVEIPDATGVSLLLTAAEWTESERKVATSAILRLIGFKAAAPATRKASKARSGEASRAKTPPKN
jgi:hypothetical protein